jgi:hypothetical protein
MPREFNWALIRSPQAYEGLIGTLLAFEYPDFARYSRPGPDAGIDGQSRDGASIWQFKFHSRPSLPQVIKDTKIELAQIVARRSSEHRENRLWNNCTEWTLVTNFDFNPQAARTWEDAVGHNFSQLGIKARIWGNADVELLLLRHRQVTRLLMAEGWQAGKKLVQRIRRECGLRVKRWLPRPRRRGRSTGTIPTRAERLNQVWSWDFVADRTDNGGRLRILCLLDEYSRECLALHVARKLTAVDLIAVMERLVAEHGAPEHICSDNGSEFIARILQQWLAGRNVKTLYIDPGSPLAKR